MEVIRTQTGMLANEAAGKLNELLEREAGKPFMLLLSGGSSFEMLEHVSERLFNTNSAVAMIDDRHSADPAVNNFLELKQIRLIKKAIDRGAELISTAPLQNESLQETADRIETLMAYWKKETPKGKFIATLGIGVDGHIAGMMPYPEDKQRFSELFEGERAIVGYDAGPKNEFPKRVTATGSFLRTQISDAVVYVKGPAKKPALEKVLAETGTCAETPARVLREMKNVFLFTDIA